MNITWVLRQLHHQFKISKSISLASGQMPSALGEQTSSIPSTKPQCERLRGVQYALRLSALGISSAIALHCERSVAQLNLTPDTAADRNLGTNVVPLTPEIDLITGGTQPQAGSNLFHSFSEFNVAPGRGVYFDNPAEVANILGRVTGTDPSDILGTLGVGRPGTQGTATLFLINPNGIVFGPGASLDVGGSFVGTTANAIQFLDGNIFSASDPNFPSPTLTVNPSAFLFNQIANQSTSSIEVTPGTVLSIGAEGNPRSLLLVGGNVLINQATLEGIDGSRIEVGGFTGSGSVELTIENNTLDFIPPTNGVEGADVTLNQALVNVGTIANDADGILLVGGTVSLTSGSQLSSSTFGEGDAGLIYLKANNVLIDDSSLFSTAEPGASGEAGGILIEAESVSLNRAILDTTNSGSGIAGDMVINARDQVSLVNSEITSESGNDITDDFGFIAISSTEGSVLLNQSTISTTNIGSGFAGDISIAASEQVSILNESGIFSLGNFGRIFIGESQDYASISPNIVTIDNQSTISTTNFASSFAGDISIAASDQVSILNQSGIFSRGNFGRIFIGESEDYASISPDLVVIDNSTLNSDNSSVEGDGLIDAGGISVTANDLVSIANGAQLTSSTFRQGNAGSIFVQTDGGDVVLSGNQTTIFTTVESGGVGDGGNIDIETASLTLSNGAQLQTLVRQAEDGQNPGLGNAGNVTINVQDTVTITGVDSEGFPSLIASSVESGATGNGGIIDITAGSFELTDGALINASTSGSGDAGIVIVQTTDDATIEDESGIFSIVTTEGIGNAGGILMEVGSLSIDNGSGLTTQTSGVGDAGIILVLTNGDVSVEGEGSGIFSTAELGSTGVAGGIGIEARSLYITDGAEVSVNNQSTGEAGLLLVDVYRDIFLLDGGSISATTLSGEGGDIELNVGDFLVLGNNGNISTTAGQAPGGGNGGNVNIISPYIISAPLDDNNITAQAYTGNGGRIEINTNRLYAIARRDSDFSTSNDITASSRFGINGIEEVNSVDIDPTQGLTNLPANPVDPSSLIAQNCTPRSRDSAREENKFTITGRGGLPPNPNSTLQSESVVTNWVGVDQPVENPTDESTSATPERVAPTATNVPKVRTYTEAQGWVIGEKGEVILTAQTPTVTPHNSSLAPAAICNGS